MFSKEFFMVFRVFHGFRGFHGFHDVCHGFEDGFMRFIDGISYHETHGDIP